MVDLVRDASRICKGPILIVCEGRTKKYRYSAVPYLLAADLHRAGFNLRKPSIYHRVGIPGSGGPDWFRNDYEVILCVTRPGKLPWSDNTACGQPPKFAPGGEISHRLASGARVNGHATRGYANGDTRNGKGYDPPELANPGNVILPTFTLDEVRGLLATCGIPDKAATEVIKCHVGGGQLGNNIAHDNEAPFPEALAERFVRSCCPPGGIVLDCFSGSGTTAAVAVREGRRALACDFRESQVQLTRRRCEAETPTLFPAGLEAC